MRGQFLPNPSAIAYMGYIFHSGWLKLLIIAISSAVNLKLRQLDRVIRRVMYEEVGRAQFVIALSPPMIVTDKEDTGLVSKLHQVDCRVVIITQILSNYTI